MYMYKTSISWSVWEGEHLGVSTFLTNYIKCTQGWIFYLFGFFFRTTPYSVLDFWTWKITTSFTNIQVTKPPSTLLVRLPLPCQPLPPDTAGGRLVPKSWDLSSKQSDLPGPDGWDSWKLFLLLPGAVPPYLLRGPPPARDIYVWIFKARVHI